MKMVEPVERVKDAFTGSEGEVVHSWLQTGHKGLRDFWEVYETHYEEISRGTQEAQANHPELGKLFPLISPEQQKRSAAQTREALQAAMDGDPSVYDELLRERGRLCAQSGISLSGWFVLTRDVQRQLVPRLIEAYGSDPSRLAAALNAMQAWVTHIHATLGQAFIDTRERLLNEERLRYRQLFDCSPLAMYVFDLESLRFLAVNELMVKLYGWSEAEFLQMTIRDIRPPEEWPKMQQSVADPPKFGEKTYWRHWKKDGSRLDVEVRSHPLTFAGKAARIIAINDLTEHRKLEAQFRQAQKMDAIGKLAGGVAHDFNNILTAMLSFSSFALQDLPPNSPARDDIAEVIAAGRRGALLTRQLLTFSRQEVVRFDALDLNGMILESEKMWRRLIPADIDLVTRCTAKNIVHADRGHVEQVLLNLVVNARDAMPEGGKLTVETSDVELDETYVRGHVGVRPGPYVMLSVTDTGVGMSDQTMSRIFEPFFTTKPEGKGTGLGLATVFGIVKQSGGEVQVYSVEGRGTTFKVYLPIAKGADAGREARASSEEARGTETILLVEDADAVRAVAKRALLRAGYKLLEAATPSEALRLCKEHAQEIALVLTDIVMPEMNGRELARAIQEQCPTTRLMFMSGFTAGAMVHQGVVSEDVAFLQKPFTPEVLLKEVRAALDRGGPSR